MRLSLLPLLLLVLAGCPRGGAPTPKSTQAAPPDARQGPAGATYVDWYPPDISLPAGVQYPCAVTALPLELEGVPEDERGYVNHACAVIIAVMREKQVLLTRLAHGESASGAHGTYDEASQAGLARLRGEPVPNGLEPFHAKVIEAIELHRAFFDQAVPRAAGGASMEQIHQIPEGRTASGKLLEAWGIISARYTAWSPAVKDSVYHHLCGLDLF